MIWLAMMLVVLALAGLGIWRWAMANQSVAMLDSVDRIFTGGDAVSLGEPAPYGEHPQQVIHLYGPPVTDDSEAWPVVVFIHGGGWRAGNPEDYAFVARNLAPEGFVVVNAGYRLGPDGKFPAMLEDGAAALAWVKANIAGYGGDPDRIYLLGHSAGAYNAAMLALDRQWLGREGLADDTIKGVVGLAGPYDFLPLDGESVELAFGDAPRIEQTQPVAFARGDAPPMLLATGTADTTVKPRNSKALAEALTAGGQPTKPVLFQDLSHEAIVMALSRPFERGGTVKRAILDFLHERETELDSGTVPSLPVQGETG